MSRSPSPRWLRRPALLAIVFAIIAGAPVVLAVSSDSSGDGGLTAGNVLALTLFVVLGVATIVLVGRMLAGVDPEATQLAEHLAGDPEQQRLLARWLGRARWARNIGGLCGLVVWVLGAQMNGDVLVWGVGGIALGAMLAELHHVRPAPGPRTASLEVRSIDDYLPAADRRRMIGVGIVAGVVTLAGIGLSDARGAALAGLAALVVLAAARAVQWRVATRPRPAIAESLRSADDLARTLAIGSGLARPATFFALALIAKGSWLLVPAIGDLGGVLGVATWLYALYLWWSNRRLGLDHLLDRPDPALA